MTAMINRTLAFVLVTATLLTACADTGQNTQIAMPVKPNGIIDDFEETTPAWHAGTWPTFNDSSATRVAASVEHVTRGSRSIQFSFDKSNLPKAIFTLERTVDLSSGQSVDFDLYNENGAAESVSIALQFGPQWQESPPIVLKPGNNAIHFALNSATFKTAESGWQYTALQGAWTMLQLAIIIAPNKAGNVYIDKLLLTKTSLTQAATALSNAPSTSPLSMQPASQKVVQFGRLDFNISTTLTVSNTFDPRQIAIDVELKSPSGAIVSIPAFTYQDFSPDGRTPTGPQQWQARFTPTEEGEWTSSATLKLDDGMAIYSTNAVSFTVLPDVSRGFVRTSLLNPQYLAFDNSEAFFPVGINLAWGHDEPLQDYARWFDALKQNGANVARIWMASWSFGIEWKDLGLGRYRLDRAWLLDQVLQMAEQRGIYIILVLINHGAFNIRVNPEWVDNPYNMEQGGPCRTPDDFASNPLARSLFKQRLRYIAARWAYSPHLLAWEWWNEVNFTPFADPNLLRPWLQEMTAYLRTVDPYHHLTSISYSDANDPRIVAMPELDILQQHLYSADDPRLSMAKAYRDPGNGAPQKLDKPVLFTEFGFSSAGEQPTRFDSEGIQFHNGLWAATFTGFASAAMYWWWDSYIEPNQYWYHLKGLSHFLADQDVSLLTPKPAEVMTSTAQASMLGRNDSALVWLRSASYSVDVAESQFRMATLFNKVNEADWRVDLTVRQGISVTLTGLQTGTYKVEWFDTRTTDLVASQSAASKDGRLVITAPMFSRDLAAKVALRTP